MEDSITIAITHSEPEKRANGLLKWYNSILDEFKSKQMGYAAIAILGQSCIGSIAVMLLMMHEMPREIKFIFLFLITIFCMFFNAAVLSQQKSKTVFNLLIISVVLSSGIIIANLF